MGKSVNIDIRILLFLGILGIIANYSYFLSNEEIINIIKDEYILLGLLSILTISFVYFKIKLRNFETIEYFPNLHNVDLKMSLLMFVLFQVVDFYFEDGFIGMISQWFMYWIFGCLVWLATHNINFYKNLKIYN